MLSVSGVLVTRGDVPTKQILRSWPFVSRHVWDNSKLEDLKVLGRYEGMMRARHATVFVQDDDCLAPAKRMLGRYRGKMLINVPPDEQPLVGWGALFERDQAHKALKRYLARFPFDDVFLRCCDLVVTGLVEHDRVDYGHTDLPWADSPDRMFRMEGHYEERQMVRERCLTL